MSKRLILIFALAFVLGISAYTYAEVQNVKVSGDLTIRAITRDNMDLTGGTSPSSTSTVDEGSWLMSTVRLRLDADLTDNVAATVRLLNERDWGEGTPAGDDIDLDLAYVTVRDFLDSPLTLTLGRQELRFGNGMIIADPDTPLYSHGIGTTPGSVDIVAMDLSARKSFDALRATLDLAPWVVDAFYAKIDEANINRNDDIDLYGINAQYDFGVNNAIGELYLFVKDTGGSANATSNKAAKIYNLGGRTSVGPFETLPLILQAELAHQFGNVAPSSVLMYMNPTPIYHNSGHRDAWATMLSATMLLPPRETPSSLTLTYNYFSGDKKVDGRCKAWDIMYYDLGNVGSVDAALFGISNLHLVSLVGTTKIMPDLDVDARLRYSHYLWDKKYPAGSQAVGVYSNALMTDKREIGDTLELDLNYAYTEDVSFGFNTGVFFPGDSFDSSNDSDIYQVMGTMKVTF